MWSLGWVADYPGPNDFLGVLLGTGASNNYGRWSSAPFDAAIAEAGRATDPQVAAGAYDRAETIVRDEVPVVPLAYGPGWALARTGLLGAGQNGLGHRPDGRPGMGRVMRRRLLALVAGGAASLVGVVPVTIGAPTGPTFGTPTAESSFETGVRVQPAGDGQPGRGPRRAAADDRRRARADRHRRHRTRRPPEPAR